MTDVSIEARHLSRRFGRHVAVDDLSFTLSAGEVVGFLGPNGAGKSTTMRMLTGYLAPTSGDALVLGKPIARARRDIKQAIGYLPEGSPSYGDMTAHEFLRFIARVRGFSKNAQQEAIDRVTDALSLEEALPKPIEALSKGYKRRVGLAQALLHDPKVLILDEPTDGLDPNQKHQVRTLIANLAKDKMVLISTHILEEIEAMASRVLLLSEGKLIVDESRTDFLARAQKDSLGIDAVFRQLTLGAAA